MEWVMGTPFKTGIPQPCYISFAALVSAVLGWGSSPAKNKCIYIISDLKKCELVHEL